MTLTLPITPGKRYVRRDGVTIVARPHSVLSSFVRVDTKPDDAPCDENDFVYVSSGQFSLVVPGQPLDLVADAPPDVNDLPPETLAQMRAACGRPRPTPFRASSTLDTQIAGTHYRDMGLQPWQAFDHWLTRDQHLGYLLGTAMAYQARYNATGVGKGGIEDIRKAIHVLQRMVEVYEAA